MDCMNPADMGSKWRGVVTIGLGALCISAWVLPSLLDAQVTPEDSPPSSDQYSETLEVTVVEVPVRVLVKGEPIAGLTGTTLKSTTRESCRR